MKSNHRTQHRTVLLGCLAILATLGGDATSLCAAEMDSSTPAADAGKPPTKKGAARNKAKSKARVVRATRQLRTNAGQSTCSQNFLPGSVCGAGDGSVGGAGGGVQVAGQPGTMPSFSTKADATGANFNLRIVEFASSRLGTQVGDGECTALAEEALAAVGARPAAGYSFGREIALRDALPGDILQFESAGFEGPDYWMILGVPHHTAIVSAVQGTRMKILHQHFNGDRTVQETVINFANLKSGQVTVYRATSKS